MRPSDLDEEAHDDETATLLMQQRTELALVPTKIEKDINESIAKARAGQPRTCQLRLKRTSMRVLQKHARDNPGRIHSPMSPNRLLNDHVD